MKYVCYGLLLLLALVFQSAGYPGLSLFGVRPDLILLSAVFFGMVEGPVKGAVFGFVGGLFQDLLLGRLIGLGAVTVMSAALALGFVGRRLYKENLLVRFLTVLGGTWTAQVLYLLGKVAFGLSVSWSFFTWRTVLGTGLFNGLISIILFRPLERLNERIVYWDELLKRTG